MRADSQVYPLTTTGVAIRGGQYAFMADAAATLSVQSPDGAWLPLTALYGGTNVALTAAGVITPIALPACVVKSSVANGSWLAGIG